MKVRLNSSSNHSEPQRDGEGYIVDRQRNERETTPGNEIHIDDFAGVEKGSQLFLTMISLHW